MMVRQNHQKALLFSVKWPRLHQTIVQLYKGTEKCLLDTHMVKGQERVYTLK